MKNKQINSFIKSVSDKNYSEANKQLKSIIENKLLNRINNHKNFKIFQKT